MNRATSGNGKRMQRRRGVERRAASHGGTAQAGMTGLRQLH